MNDADAIQSIVKQLLESQKYAAMLEIASSTKTCQSPGGDRRQRFDGDHRKGVLREVSAVWPAAICRLGEYVAIVGESGHVGKSTLLNLVAGLDRPDSGRIRLVLDGCSSTTPAAVGLSWTARRGCADPSAPRQARLRLPGFSRAAASDRAPERRPAAVAAGPAWRRADEPAQQLLDAVGLGERAASWPRELSGGEMQRVAIARALVHRPRLVLADEPTGNLDPANGAKVLALLAERIRQAGAIGILVTHSLEAAATADRVLRLTTNGLHGVMRLAPVFLGSLARRRMATLFSLRRDRSRAWRSVWRFRRCMKRP
jgi:putative ABC transport system ATP-binding protein